MYADEGTESPPLANPRPSPKQRSIRSVRVSSNRGPDRIEGSTVLSRARPFLTAL